MTLVPNKFTRPWGCENLHAVFLQHRADRGGTSPTVTILIPEAADNLTVAAVPGAGRSGPVLTPKRPGDVPAGR